MCGRACQGVLSVGRGAARRGAGRRRGGVGAASGRGWAGRVNCLVFEVDFVARDHAGMLALEVSSDAGIRLAAVSCGRGDSGAE